MSINQKFEINVVIFERNNLQIKVRQKVSSHDNFGRKIRYQPQEKYHKVPSSSL
ncbi:MAG: hypothetical protein QNJ68_19360 [Microcoleaceae cyanobacterium MO_207.B10]|nr:hypothetical protein [Microcoleaceae cyanobacterium MO_207.B10]